MKRRWRRRIAAGIGWSFLSLLVLWFGANILAALKIAAYLRTYQMTSTASPEQIVSDFGKTLNPTTENPTDFPVLQRLPATEIAQAVAPQEEIRSYLERSEVKSRLEDYRNLLGSAVSSTLLACLIANSPSELVDSADIRASRASLDAIQLNPQASLSELREVAARASAVPGRDHLVTLSYSIAQSLVTLPGMQTPENQRALEDMHTFASQE